ncbi:hypothetical protein [Methylomonas sp. HYX-M1]|uniref:hypothetical protein n=1 Tax=Methylomonas sp. HYX-M1 TaxID=3139307 RepID=UPI00345C035C
MGLHTRDIAKQLMETVKVTAKLKGTADFPENLCIVLDDFLYLKLPSSPHGECISGRYFWWNPKQWLSNCAFP